MIDLHSHILYGFDDGAKNRDTCCRMLELYASGGVKIVCASSHSKADTGERYMEYFVPAAQLADSFGITLLPAQEYALTDLLAAPRYHLGDGKYFLLDTANFPIDNALINKLKPLSAQGNFILWAHPERLHSRHPEETARMYALLRGSGCQLNGASLLGHFGKEVKNAAWQLLEKGFCSVISSDAHTPEGVTAWLKSRELLNKLYPEELTDLWYHVNPQDILAVECVKQQDVPPLSLKQKICRFFCESGK